MSTVMGLALTTMLGASPFTATEDPSWPAWTLLVLGLLLLTGTLVLVLHLL
jgi:hypothetical protein